MSMTGWMRRLASNGQTLASSAAAIPALNSTGRGLSVEPVWTRRFTIDPAGNAYVVTDNDGVDDSSGETLFLRLGKIEAMN